MNLFDLLFNLNRKEMRKRREIRWENG